MQHPESHALGAIARYHAPVHARRWFFDRMNEAELSYVLLDRADRDDIVGIWKRYGRPLDVLVQDLQAWQNLFPAAQPLDAHSGSRMRLVCSGVDFTIEVRSRGDNFLPRSLQDSLLAKREWHRNGYFVPAEDDYRIMLAYQAVYHREGILAVDRYYLGHASLADLIEYLQAQRIGWVRPKDDRVAFRRGSRRGSTSVALRCHDRVLKRQMFCLDYALVRNEHAILSRLESPHVPRVHGIRDRSILLEYCGVPLLHGLPWNWKQQLQSILGDLRRAGVMHRDISLGNLTVKDGVVRLIDFGWAKFEDEVESMPPPACLGHPNRAPWGFDDRYSMHCVEAQVEAALTRGVVVPRW